LAPRTALAPVIALGTLLCCAAPAAAQKSPAFLHAQASPPPEHRADPGLRTYVFRFGPHTVGPYQTIRRADLVLPPPEAGHIVGMDARTVDENGAPIPQNEVMLHHIVFANGGPDGTRRDGACPERTAANERFYGTSEELRPLTLPRGYGYPTAPADQWKAIWMVMNHESRIRTSYVEYRVTVDPSPGITPVKPYWLSVLHCDRSPDPQYTVPGGGARGSVHRRARDWRLPVSGRIVAVGGHLHGGGRVLAVSQPACGGRVLAASAPTYAPTGDPLYSVRPLLHEPDPKDMSWLQSATGWGVTAGEPLRVIARYDGERVHTRVMGIAHVYLAEGAPPAGCSPPPGDIETLGAGFAGRAEPPRVRMTLALMGPDGVARQVSRPPGRVRRMRRGARVVVRRQAFNPPNLSIARGASIRWAFRDPVNHDATTASGPEGFASPIQRGRDYVRRFTKPGEYRILCSIHPVGMAQYVRVRRR
jgi:plastocyanin